MEGLRGLAWPNVVSGFVGVVVDAVDADGAGDKCRGDGVNDMVAEEIPKLHPLEFVRTNKYTEIDALRDSFRGGLSSS